MSPAPSRTAPGAVTRTERLQSPVAMAVSVLLHVLLVMVLLYSAKPTVTTPQGAPSGSRTRVDFIGETRDPAPPEPRPPTPPAAPRPSPATPRAAASPVQSTLVDQAEDPVPPQTGPRSQAPGQRPAPEPQPDPAPVPPQPPAPPAPPAPTAPPRPPATPPPTTARQPRTWGKPPGYIDRDAAPDNAGPANSPSINNGRGRDMTNAGPSMELGGYLVYYDVLSEDKLRQWQAQGMKEVSIPLPGTRYYMVCPLEIALERGSGKCRALDPYDPEMKQIGDAREAVTMLQIYKQGELVWRGPGPYR